MTGPGEGRSLTYLLIFLVVLVALSPLISMMPSRRQRQLADLRQAAAMAGLYVKLREYPGAAAAEPLVAFYGRHRPRDSEGGAGRVACVRESGAWRIEHGQPGPERRALLEQLPAGVSRLESDIRGAGVFWDEQGDPDTVRGLDQVLKDWLANTNDA